MMEEKFTMQVSVRKVKSIAADERAPIGLLSMRCNGIR